LELTAGIEPATAAQLSLFACFAPVRAKAALMLDCSFSPSHQCDGAPVFL